MTRPGTISLIATLVAASASAGARGDTHGTGPAGADCRPQSLNQSYLGRVTRALRAREDVWGNALLAAPGGPTLAGARRYLNPLTLGKAAKGASLTGSGVHYVPFSGQVDTNGSGSMALHVADGSQIVSQRASGRSLTIGVGAGGRERFGSCLVRLQTPRLGDGYLPILETRYRDANGVRYRQESFASRIPETRSLVSFVALTADTRTSRGSVQVRFAASEPQLVTEADRLVREDDVYLIFGPGGAASGSSITYDVPRGIVETVYAAWLNSPAPVGELRLDRTRYESTRRGLARYWAQRLSGGMTIDVPERSVLDARRSLLVQNLSLTWRYSVGNPYQQFSFPEGVDVAQMLSAQGFPMLARAILLKSLEIPLTQYRNWKIGQKLVGSGLYYRLSHDKSYVAAATPALRKYVAEIGSQVTANPRGILDRERFSSDIKDSVYGLHTQAVVWQGLRSMASVWSETGQVALAKTCRALAARLERGLRRAIGESRRRLPDGSLFVPMRLLAGEKPYETVTESRAGGYWNLVAPYAFASGLFAPGSPEARGALRYMLLHGSRMLGLVRAGAYSLYGLEPTPPESGVNPVYGLNAARFLADSDRPDQLVLSLYGQLAAGMAPGTFVSGEGLSVAPLGGEYHRSMYLPPNGASNGSFLETLRLMLVHETLDRAGAPRGLELAFATPRAWLQPGKEIVVRRAPTSFGPVSFAIASSDSSVRATIDVPSRAPLRTLQLRLRLPRGSRVSGVFLDGRRINRFDPRENVVELPTRAGRLHLIVRVAKR